MKILKHEKRDMHQIFYDKKRLIFDKKNIFFEIKSYGVDFYEGWYCEATDCVDTKHLIFWKCKVEDKEKIDINWDVPTKVFRD